MNFLEYEEQKIIFKWAALNEKVYPCLKFLNASLNGVHFTNKLSAARAKATGLKSGFPDLFLPYPNGKYAGLFIELKRPKGLHAKGRIQASQQVWIDYLNSVGYKALVCYGAKESIDVIKDYLLV